jgi:hypothetical protein
MELTVFLAAALAGLAGLSGLTVGVHGDTYLMMYVVTRYLI